MKTIEQQLEYQNKQDRNTKQLQLSEFLTKKIKDYNKLLDVIMMTILAINIGIIIIATIAIINTHLIIAGILTIVDIIIAISLNFYINSRKKHVLELKSQILYLRNTIKQVDTEQTIVKPINALKISDETFQADGMDTNDIAVFNDIITPSINTITEIQTKIGENNTFYPKTVNLILSILEESPKLLIEAQPSIRIINQTSDALKLGVAEAKQIIAEQKIDTKTLNILKNKLFKNKNQSFENTYKSINALVEHADGMPEAYQTIITTILQYSSNATLQNMRELLIKQSKQLNENYNTLKDLQKDHRAFILEKLSAQFDANIKNDKER